MKRVKKYILLLVTLSLTVFALLLFATVSMRNAYTPVPSDCAIILGHSLVDGQTPDTLLKNRLEKGVSLYTEGLCQTLIVTGGQGPRDNLAVASAMKNYLVAQGIPEEDILVENQAKNTYENLIFAKELADEYQLSSAIIVTSDFHIFRSMLMASAVFSSVSGASAPSAFNFETFVWYLKEPFSLTKYFLVDYL